MKFRDAVEKCKVRGYIARDAEPQKHYAKNHNAPLECRVAWQDQICHDWNHYDPEALETSVVG